MRVAIIGAGISGLALAYYLQKLGVRYDLFEAEAEAGGMIKSVTQGPYQLELGPPLLQMTPEMQELVQELKLEEEMVRPATKTQDIYIRKDGQYQAIPFSLRRLLLSPYFHWRTKLKITQEVHVPAHEIQDETVAHFFRRRFGQDMLNYLVQPVVTTLFGGDPEKLLLDKTLPEIKDLERTHGSVLKGLDLQAELFSPAVFSFTQGLQSLPKAIASKLVSFHASHKVEMVHKTKGKYLLSIQHDVEGLADEEFDAVVLAVPPHIAAELLDYTSPGLAAALQNVNYGYLTVVHTAYRRHTVNFPLEGLGVFHPQQEKPFAHAVVWGSTLFPRTCPDDEVLFTSFVNPALERCMSELPDDEVFLRAHEELKENFGISANLPVFQHVHRWPHAFPQQDIFISDAHVLVRALEQDQLYACANWVSGPTIPQCVLQAKQLAQKIYSQRPSLP